MTVDCWKTRDEGDLATVAAMTEDRGMMMAGIRRTYGEGDAGLFHLTSLFERIIWLLRQIGLSLGEKKGAAEYAEYADADYAD